MPHPAAPRTEAEPASAELEAFRKKLLRRAKKNSMTPPEASSARDGSILYSREVPRVKARSFRRRVTGEGISLAGSVQGAEVSAPNGGKAFRIEQRLADREENWTALRERFTRCADDARSGMRRRVAALCSPGNFRADETIFLDLETTGLAGTPVFLIGTMECAADDFVLRQYFARDYSEESAILSLALERIGGKRLLVSFNGKSFDVPYVRLRAAVHGIPFARMPAHFDLLHEARRVWRRELPNCRLQTLESAVCRRSRYGDIPGHEIPEAYHAFVRTGDASEMIEVLHHNALDLITLADLMTRLPAIEGF